MTDQTAQSETAQAETSRSETAEAEAGRRAVRLARRALVFAAAASLVGLAFGPRIGLSVLGGAAVAVANILVLRRVVSGLDSAPSTGATVALALLTVGRYALLGGALFAIIAVWNADVIGVVCGLGAPLLAVLPELGRGGLPESLTARRIPPALPRRDGEDKDSPPPDAH